METTEVKAILFDTRSIQRYIFSGNKLRTNIGASYIVENLFKMELIPILEEVFPGHSDLETWEQVETPSFRDFTEDCRIAYIGGGNALVLFRQDTPDEVLAKVVEAFTKKLLVTYPGLKTGAAIGSLVLSPQAAYQKSDEALHHLLKHNQNTVFPQVNVPYTGLTQACGINGEVANYQDINHVIEPKGVARFFSQEVAAKAMMMKQAHAALQDKFVQVIDGYEFPTEFSKLGQKETENYIAIVHVDGNNMGQKFMSCRTLEDRVRLSKAVKEKTEQAFAKLLQTIVDEYDGYEDFLALEDNILPIRPLILGGDDATFICAGKMAVTYAKRFIEFIKEGNSFFAGGIDSCGGVAILPASYPFFRGYELAEQLCDAAKKVSRIQNGCWLDFALLHGEQAPTLGQIRAQEYRGILGDLHFGPYAVCNSASPVSLDKILQCARLFAAGQEFEDKTPQEAPGLAKNKIKELRSVLQHGEHDCQQFLEQIGHMHQQLPHIEGWEEYKKNLWFEGRTPYVEAIELIDFMPKEG